MLIKHKKANLLPGTTAFLIAMVLFIALMFLFLANIGKGDSFIEKVYAKKIALAIDVLKPGTELTIYLNEVFDRAKKNDYTGQVVFPDYTLNKITVRVNKGEGYSYIYFTNLPYNSISIDRNENKLVIKS